MLIIGSHAMQAKLQGLTELRHPRDIDLIGRWDEVQTMISAFNKTWIVEARPFAEGKKYVLKLRDGRIFEYEIAWPGTTAEWLIRLVEEDRESVGIVGHPTFHDVVVPSLDILYALKLSHRYLKNSPHFLKTMQDIHKMRSFDATLRIEHVEWFKARQKETYNYGHPSLMVKKGDFFKGDGVSYVYDHDDIHVTMAHLKNHLGLVSPAYRFYMKDGAEVDCDKNKFFYVNEEVRLLGVLEETQVLALERSQIPFKGKVEPKASFDMALMKVCTSITSGWFREFAWESYDKVQSMYEEDYVDRFWSAVDSGLVRKVEENVQTTNMG